MNCPVCGGTMIGDGYTTPIHCENVDIDPWIEPDFGPIYCVEEPAEMSDEEYAREEYYRMAEQAYQHELDRDYEANMPLSPSGNGKVYGWEDDIPF